MFGKKRLKVQLAELNQKVENAKINEYVLMMNDTRKLLWKNFISGIAKGLGTAIGFTVLAAIVLIILRRIVLLNIPVIGKYLKDILDIVDSNT